VAVAGIEPNRTGQAVYLDRAVSSPRLERELAGNAHRQVDGRAWPEAEVVSLTARLTSLHADAAALLRRLDDQSLGVGLRGCAPLDFDEHLVLVPRANLDHAVERANVHLHRPGACEREPLLFADRSLAALHVDGAGGGAGGNQDGDGGGAEGSLHLRPPEQLP
jgi:hypothetical protein